VGGEFAHAEAREPFLQEQRFELVEHLTMPGAELRLGALRDQWPGSPICSD
jgi:hypothetical protein